MVFLTIFLHVATVVVLPADNLCKQFGLRSGPTKSGA